MSEMIAAAKDSNAVEDTEDPLLLDVKAFARALTADVMLYNPSVEKRATTNYVDAFGPLYNPIHRSNNPDNFQDDSQKRGLRKSNNSIMGKIMNGLDDSVIAVTIIDEFTSMI